MKSETQLEVDRRILELNVSAEKYFDKSDYTACIEAMKCYEAKGAARALRLSALMWHARCEIELQHNEEAEQVLRDIYAEKPDFVEKFYADKLLVTLYERHGRFEEAELCVSSMLNILAHGSIGDEEEKANLLVFLAGLKVKKKEYLNAIEIFDLVEQEFGLAVIDSNSMLCKARAFMSLKRFTEAESFLIELLKRKPIRELADAYYALGATFFEMGHYEKAKLALCDSLNSLPGAAVTKEDILYVLRIIEDNREPRTSRNPTTIQ